MLMNQVLQENFDIYPYKTWNSGWVGTPMFQKSPTQTRTENHKPDPKITNEA
jgi:hypothetical protein